MPGEAFRRVFRDIIADVSVTPSGVMEDPGGESVEHPRVAVVIEDEPDIRSLLADVLEQAGFVVHPAGTGLEGIELVREHDPVVTTLDVSMPGMDGFETAKRIRAFSHTYLVMLTARADEIDTLQGLQSGADDYITKPFRPRELRARIEAMLRRPRAMDAGRGVRRERRRPRRRMPRRRSMEGWLEHRGLRLHPAMRVVSVDGADVELTRSEFDIVGDLLEARGRVVSKGDLALLLRGDRGTGVGLRQRARRAGDRGARREPSPQARRVARAAALDRDRARRRLPPHRELTRGRTALAGSARDDDARVVAVGRAGGGVASRLDEDVGLVADGVRQRDADADDRDRRSCRAPPSASDIPRSRAWPSAAHPPATWGARRSPRRPLPSSPTKALVGACRTAAARHARCTCCASVVPNAVASSARSSSRVEMTPISSPLRRARAARSASTCRKASPSSTPSRAMPSRVVSGRPGSRARPARSTDVVTTATMVSVTVRKLVTIVLNHCSNTRAVGPVRDEDDRAGDVVHRLESQHERRVRRRCGWRPSRPVTDSTVPATANAAIPRNMTIAPAQSPPSGPASTTATDAARLADADDDGGPAHRPLVETARARATGAPFRPRTIRCRPPPPTTCRAMAPHTRYDTVVSIPARKASAQTRPGALVLAQQRLERRRPPRPP